ncbi:MAG: hypothetical protein D6814_03305 [Calditrichaeota bacterium]|nr:MAG: hypothetical protein D6814_03305 [Calditrichota bacterium]
MNTFLGKRPIAGSEAGNLKAALAIIVFSFISFFVSFGTVWIALIGFKNPLQDQVPEETAKNLARADSLRVQEMALLQDIEKRKSELQKLTFLGDSLEQEITSRKKIIGKLDREIERLKQQLGNTEDDRVKKLAAIIAGLSEENLKKVTDNMDVNLLVSIVLNLSPKKAQNILNAMEPRRAALVAQKMAQIKKMRQQGG